MRVVLDTNIVISAVLFKGKLSSLVSLWKAKQFTFVISGEILKEYLRVLSYPKFKLTESEIRTILSEELLPFVETVNVKEKPLGILKDKDDEKFLNCVRHGHADVLVSGDAELLQLGSYHGTRIVNAEMFLSEF